MGNALGAVLFLTAGSVLGYLIVTKRIHIGNSNLQNQQGNTNVSGPEANLVTAPASLPPVYSSSVLTNNVMAPVHIP